MSDETSSMYPSASGAGHSTSIAEGGASLPMGTRLAEFEIRSMLGSGGFGIVYLAWDHALEREVALKEYLPGTLAGRGKGLSVALRSAAMADTFALGLRSFVNEARMLARFNHPSLVKVYRFWEDNSTAYMVMPYYKGRTLRHMRAGMVVPPGEAACRRVIDALLSALEVLHKEGVYHRDIAPDNILIGEDGVPVLLDFGAARRVIGEGTQALTSIIKPHYAPLEQYADQSVMRQGPWTDLYALGGTAYFLLTGKEPVPAASRALHDDQPRLADHVPAGCSPAFAAAIDWMLALKPPERPQSVAMLRDVLEGRIALPRRLASDRTVPGWAARDSSVRITTPGAFEGTDFDPTADTSTRDTTEAPTMVLPSPPRSEPTRSAPPPQTAPEPAPPMTMMVGRTAPPSAAAAAAPAVAAPATAMPRRWLGGLLAALLLVNALAWWWSFHSRQTPPPNAATAAAMEAAVPSPSESSKTVPTATQPSATVANDAKETILSVMPARVSRAASAPASAAIAAGATALVPPARAVDPAASGARAKPADAKSVAIASAIDASVGPRARCGDRVFLSMLICMKRECEQPALSNHPECVQMREQEESVSRRRDSR